MVQPDKICKEIALRFGWCFRQFLFSFVVSFATFAFFHFIVLFSHSVIGFDVPNSREDYEQTPSINQHHFRHCGPFIHRVPDERYLQRQKIQPYKLSFRVHS